MDDQEIPWPAIQDCAGVWHSPIQWGPEDACMWAQVVTLELARSYREKGLGEHRLDCGWTPSLRRGEPGVGAFLCMSALSFGSECF